ncbi:phosphotransferase family protein [Tropicibacter sp. S64]|uniref:phosphotransferase family protein n=1 Tax=Tropicibacter sp. S64 TaxID=3415122 RepID=UPI003C7B5DF8
MRQAAEAVRGLWPGWAGALVPLGTSGERAVFRVKDAPCPAVVKCWPEAQRGKALAQVARQGALAEAMGDGRFRVPEVLHVDEDRLALVMHDCGGRDLGAALETSDETAAARLLSAGGGWIAALHGLTRREAPFRPAPHLNWLNKLVAQAKAGTRRIDDLPRFKAQVTALQAMVSEVRRRPSLRAVTHKDLNAGNLLVDDGGTLWGIDVENGAEDEALRDLFSLALDGMGFASCGGDRRALAALGRGYGVELGDPLVRLFLQRTFALGYWARTPLPHSRRQATRMRAALWILAQDGAVF